MSNYYCKDRPGNVDCTEQTERVMHLNGTSVLTGLLVLGLISITSFSPSAYTAEADPYLSAINVEGGKLESLGKAKKEEEALLRLEAAERKQARPQQPAQPQKPATDASSVNAKAFEDDLQKSFPGSYALYSLMDSGEKQQVLAEYQKRSAEGAGRYIPVIKKIIAITNAKRTRNQ